MAAIHSGIHLKLKNTKIPWEDKIKLAHFAWISHQCFLPNKEQVLLDWVCHALTGQNTKKLNLEEDVVRKLWSFLDDVLRSKRLQSLMIEGKSIKLRFAIAQAIIDVLSSSIAQQTPCGIASVLSCCQSILSNPALAFVYTAKYELMVDLLSKLCALACCYLSSGQAVTVQVFNVLYLCLTQYLQIQRQQSNPNRIFTHVMAQLFQPCLLLRHALLVRAWSKDDDNQVRHQLSKDIRNNIDTLLCSALFQPELRAFYKEDLSERGQLESKKGLTKALLTPVSSMLAKLEDTGFCDPETHVSIVANSVPLLYKLFLDSYCKDGKEIFCFHFIVKLFDCLQSVASFGQKDVSTTFSSASMGFIALEQLLNLVLAHDVYNVAEDHIRHQDVQFRFYRKLAEMLLYNPCASSPSWFRCLKSLILLNHLIVEPDLDDLLSCAWIDADISDARIRKAQEALISSLIETYTKLRQFPKLFNEALLVICRPAADELREPVLTSGLSEKFADFLIQLPPNQILDVWDLFLVKCGSFIYSDIKDDPDVCLKLVSLSSLLHCLLFNMKSLDNNSPVPVVSRFITLMKRMMDELILPSLKIIKEHDVEDRPLIWLQKLCDMALLLLYTWIEVNATTMLHCNKYVSQINEIDLSLESPIDGWDLSIFCEDQYCWKKVYEHYTGSNAISTFYLELLSVLKMKYVLMLVGSPNEALQLTLHKAASLIVHSVSDLALLLDNITWCGNVAIIDTSSVSVAHWHLVASNLPLLLPYISLEDINNITDFLLETILPSQYTKDPADKDGSVTFGDISSALLRSDHFPEMQLLQCAFITSVINKCAKILEDKPNLGKMCKLLSDRHLHWHEDSLSSNNKGVKLACPADDVSPHEQSASEKNLEAVVQCILSMTKENNFGLGDSEINDLRGVMDIFFTLRPDSLTPGDQSRCFLLLLSIVRTTSLSSLQLSSICYRLMIFLLNGKHGKSVFKLFFASDILNTLMVCLQPGDFEFASSMENTQYWAEFVPVVQSLFHTLLAMITERKQSCLLNLEKFAEFVFQVVPNTESKDWNSCVGQLLIAVLNSLCQVLTTFIQQPIADKQKTGAFRILLQRSVGKMNAAVQQCLKVSSPSDILPSFLVSCTTTLLEAELGCQEKLGPQNVELYRGFCLQILRELYCAEKQTEFLKNAFRYLAVCINVEEISSVQQMLVSSVFHSLKKLLGSPWIDNEIVQNVEPELNDLFNQMMGRCSSEEFSAMLQSILQGLEICKLWQNSDKEIFAGITIIKLLLNCPLKEEKGKVFWCTASQIMTALTTLGNEACKDRWRLSSIVVPVMDTMTLLLRSGEMFLLNPHHVTLSFSTLLTVPLDHLRAEEYYSIFLAIHEVLFSILQCHPKVMLKSVSTFLSTFHRLVASIMHEGRQKGDKGTAHELALVLKCAQLVERMYTHIAGKTEDFTVFSSFIVSQHVHELQKVTLQPAVKKHLTGGIFHILDLCIERDIRFLNASLQMGVREVFKELYQEYTRQHKTRNQEDEKYTAV
ncbi:unhealthy ribosome biogenesis protein 2 homolog [Gastrophryne carolinensis]